MGFNKHQLQDLLEYLPLSQIQISIHCETENEAHEMLNKLRESCNVFLRSTAISPYELVIIGVRDGNVRPSWSETRRSENSD